MSLFIPLQRELGDTWLPSEVRRRLVAARQGHASPVLREIDGTDERQALAFSIDDDNHLESLAGDEATAALDLLGALHHGELDSYVVSADGVMRLDPKYWEPRHDAALLCIGDASRATYIPPMLMPLEDGPSGDEVDAWNARVMEEEAAAQERYGQDLAIERSIQRSALLWGEDTISNHPDRPVDVRWVGKHVVIERDAGASWIKRAKLAAKVDRSATKRPDKEELEKWANSNPDLNIRDVSAKKIGETWDGSSRLTVPMAQQALKDARGGHVPKGRPTNK